MSERESEPAPFEELLEQLEETVDKLQEPDIGLDKALEVYEDGVRILRECLSRLRSARGKVETLVKESEDLLNRFPFEPEQGRELEEGAEEDDDTAGEDG